MLMPMLVPVMCTTCGGENERSKLPLNPAETRRVRLPGVV